MDTDDDQQGDRVGQGGLYSDSMLERNDRGRRGNDRNRNVRYLR